LATKIFSDENTIESDIALCNQDSTCIGIIIQLPLSPALQPKKQYYIDLVAPQKDADCLGSALFHMSAAHG
jgi:5,10-methylene-tetrahydrofolate dehydrogenase/methenyl tetrahydrofolate cyclohydrolase